MTIGPIVPGVFNALLAGNGASKPGAPVPPFAALIAALTAQKPGAVTGLPINELLGQAGQTKAKQVDVQQMRDQLGALRTQLASDMQQLQKHGLEMPAGERQALMARVDKALARAGELETGIAGVDPQLGAMLSGVRAQRAGLQAAANQALGLFALVRASPFASPKAVADAASAFQQAIGAQAGLTADLDRKLGVLTPAEKLLQQTQNTVNDIRGQMQNAINEIHEVDRRMALPALPPAEHGQLGARQAALMTMLSGLKQQLLAVIGPQKGPSVDEVVAQMETAAEQADRAAREAQEAADRANMDATTMMVNTALQSATGVSGMRAATSRIDTLLGAQR